MTVAREVIMIGLRRTRQDSIIASPTCRPSLDQVVSELHDEDAVRHRNAGQHHYPHERHDIHRCAGEHRISNTPLIPGGSASRMMNGSRKERNCATSTR